MKQQSASFHFQPARNKPLSLSTFGLCIFVLCGAVVSCLAQAASGGTSSKLGRAQVAESKPAEGGNQVSDAASPKVVVASQAGAKLDSHVVTGGGTDETDLMQAILDRAPVLGGLHLIVDGAMLVRGLKVHSNTTIQCLNGDCGFFLREGSNRPLIQNADPSTTIRKNRNIAFLGGNYNGNAKGQAHHAVTGEKSEEWVTAFSLFGVEQVTFRDVTITNMRTFAVFITNWYRVVLENVHLNLTEIVVPSNQDGIHVQGPGQFLSMRNISGRTWDDFIALNADDVNSDWNAQGEFVGNKAFGPHVSFGPITDVDIDGVFIDEAAQAVRILSRQSRLDRVSIRNVQGTYRSFGFFIGPYYRQGGNIGRVTIDQVDLRALDPNYTYLPPFLFFLSGRMEHLTLRNIHSHLPIDGRSLVWVQPDAEIDLLTVDGMSIFEKTPSVGRSASAFRIDGRIELMEVRNLTYYRSKELPVEGSLIRTNAERADLKKNLDRMPHMLKPNHRLWGGNGWPQAYEILGRPPRIGRLLLSNLVVERLKSVVQHDAGEIGRLNLNHVVTMDVPSEVALGATAKIGEVTPASTSVK